MDLGSANFVLAIIGMSMAAWVVTTWMRVKHGYPVENEWGGTVQPVDPDQDRKFALLASENGKLLGKVSRLEERIAVLERIATDPAERTTREIDALR